ncbi:hypothetical protein C5167_029350 [Papaver somniferum]|nr:hypothetical protein C5167_029350 [Papaver somniferum]
MPNQILSSVIQISVASRSDLYPTNQRKLLPRRNHLVVLWSAWTPWSWRLRHPKSLDSIS